MNAAGAPKSTRSSNRSPGRLIGRMAWIIVRLMLALLLMQRGSTFFYQGF